VAPARARRAPHSGASHRTSSRRRAGQVLPYEGKRSIVWSSANERHDPPWGAGGDRLDDADGADVASCPALEQVRDLVQRVLRDGRISKVSLERR
jgi:hypothetical protein